MPEHEPHRQAESQKQSLRKGQVIRIGERVLSKIQALLFLDDEIAKADREYFETDELRRKTKDKAARRALREKINAAEDRADEMTMNFMVERQRCRRHILRLLHAEPRICKTFRPELANLTLMTPKQITVDTLPLMHDIVERIVLLLGGNIPVVAESEKNRRLLTADEQRQKKTGAAETRTGAQESNKRPEPKKNAKEDRNVIRTHVRWMIARDMKEVLQIENDSFEFGWTLEDFLRCLRQRNCIGLVSDYAGTVMGYAVYEMMKKKFHLLNFAVHPGMRRQTVGTQLVRRIVNHLSKGRRNRITLEIRERNLSAQLFFRDQEFKAVRFIRDYYEDTDEGAIAMEYRKKDGIKG